MQTASDNVSFKPINWGWRDAQRKILITVYINYFDSHSGKHLLLLTVLLFSLRKSEIKGWFPRDFFQTSFVGGVFWVKNLFAFKNSHVFCRISCISAKEISAFAGLIFESRVYVKKNEIKFNLEHLGHKPEKIYVESKPQPVFGCQGKYDGC